MHAAFLFVLLLSVQQTPPSPSPDGAQKHAAEPQTDAQREAGKSASSASPINGDKSQSKGASDTQGSNDGYEKWLYHAYEWATICGVAAGWIVLFFIWRQTHSVINAERAWVMVMIKAPHRNIMLANIRSSRAPHESTHISFILWCQNQGRSPGWIVEQHVRAEIVNRKDVPSEPDFTKEFQVLKETRPAPVSVELPRSIDITLPKFREKDRDYPDVDQIIYVYGFVIYRDIFSKKHRTVFGAHIYNSETIMSIDSEAFNKMD